MIESDAHLVELVLAGEKSAFGLLIDRYGREATRFARRMLSEAIDIEDVIQEAFLQAFLHLSSLREPNRFGPWLLGIVANLGRMRLRARPTGFTTEDWDGGRVPPGFTVADLEPSAEAVYEARELHNMVLAAIATLPAEQQQAVRLHYIDGLTLWEIGQLAGVPVGAVKVRLHRARARLRDELSRELADTRASIPRTSQEVSMIPVTVHDVIVRVPKGEEVKWLGEAKDWDKFQGAWIVALKEKAGERIVPIWVGLVEGNAIAMVLADVVTPRPFTFELMAQLVEASEAKVEKIAVTNLRDNVFYATIWMNINGQVREIDARPSDAVALALRVKAPIFVTPEVIDQTSEMIPNSREVFVGLEAFRRKAIEEKRGQPEEGELEYRSFRSLPRGDMNWLKPAEK